MIVLACEGNTEVYLMESLLRNGQIHFSDRLFTGHPLHCPQALRKYRQRLLRLPFDEKIVVYRIGDTLKDKLDVRGMELRDIQEIKLCTRPEIEVLILLREGLYEAYAKTKSRIRPKTFLKEARPQIRVEEYFDKNDMVWAIMEYKRIARHRKGEGYLADLLVR